MFGPAKKKDVAAIIIANMKPKDKEVETETEEKSEEVDNHAMALEAAQAFLDAIKLDDAEALLEAHNQLEQCWKMMEEEGSEGEEVEED